MKELKILEILLEEAESDYDAGEESEAETIDSLLYSIDMLNQGMPIESTPVARLYFKVINETSFLKAYNLWEESVMNNYFVIIGAHIYHIKAFNSYDLVRECTRKFGRAPEYAKKLLFS